ncbi:MAG: hypothetical protein ACRDQX_06400 [Pseudonocardiaceae bacterium]
MRILISGAIVAGPVLAYWLTRYGFTPTVVEQVSTLRKTGGPAVDLFGPALDVAERMRLLERMGLLERSPSSLPSSGTTSRWHRCPTAAVDSCVGPPMRHAFTRHRDG